MPLVVLCGYPSSGKTTICNQLKDFLENKNKRVIVISENLLVDNKKNEIYSGDSFHNTLADAFLHVLAHLELQSYHSIS